MLSKLEREFAVYAQSFFTGEESIDRNLRLKLAHSFRVRNEMRRLAEAESFSPEATCEALRTALLHDLSRFEQFQRFPDHLRSIKTRSLLHSVSPARFSARPSSSAALQRDVQCPDSSIEGSNTHLPVEARHVSI